MILGGVCTRNCLFCSVSSGEPEPVDSSEPEMIAEAAADLGLDHVVVTSVTRDDLEDGGSGHFSRVIARLKSTPDPPVIEVLVPDFRGSREDISRVAGSAPDIFSHNIETVRRTYGKVRKEADYDRSLQVLSIAKEEGEKGLLTKSAMMLGLGETEAEIIDTMKDLRKAGADFLAIGQYLRPGLNQVPVSDYITPGRFDYYRQIGNQLGFLGVAAGPLVRSSYQEIDVSLFRERSPAEPEK
jgi:lipoic acid synthetase